MGEKEKRESVKTISHLKTLERLQKPIGRGDTVEPQTKGHFGAAMLSFVERLSKKY